MKGMEQVFIGQMHLMKPNQQRQYSEYVQLKEKKFK